MHRQYCWFCHKTAQMAFCLHAYVIAIFRRKNLKFFLLLHKTHIVVLFLLKTHTCPRYCRYPLKLPHFVAVLKSSTHNLCFEHKKKCNNFSYKNYHFLAVKTLQKLGYQKLTISLSRSSLTDLVTRNLPFH